MSKFNNRIVFTGGSGRFAKIFRAKEKETKFKFFFPKKTELNILNLKSITKYLRNKSAKRVFDELKKLHNDLGVTLIRCQDTNFLSNNRSVLNQLADLIDRENLDIMLYIETRPETISKNSIPLLKKLRVDYQVFLLLMLN